jgi:hypothetical protein
MSSVEPSSSERPPSTPPPSTPPPTPPAAVRPRTALGVATLVIGVASLVAVASFVLFPLALVGGIVGLILGLIALTRSGAKRATNQGQAVAGLVCCVIALIAAATLSVRVGTWAARNTGTITRFDKCLAKAGDRADIAACISRFANDVRP